MSRPPLTIVPMSVSAQTGESYAVLRRVETGFGTFRTEIAQLPVYYLKVPDNASITCAFDPVTNTMYVGNG